MVPETVNEVAAYEKRWGKTIKKGLDVIGQADRGTPYQMTPEQRALALSSEYPLEKFFVPEGEPWVQPSGAYRRCGGPT